MLKSITPLALTMRLRVRALRLLIIFVLFDADFLCIFNMIDSILSAQNMLLINTQFPLQRERGKGELLFWSIFKTIETDFTTEPTFVFVER